jgi:peptide/nickel transport system permease protein
MADKGSLPPTPRTDKATNAPFPDPPRLKHTFSDAPFDPYSVEQVTPEQERYFLATQWQLMWWKLKRHRLAVWSGIFLLLLYASIFVSEILAPYALDTRNSSALYHPPQAVHLFHEGEFMGPFVYGTKSKFDLKDFEYVLVRRHV